ncbi:MAG TPA: sensor histidine kinase [Puia sp.]|jgi:two-component sensor histidine kinase
MRLVSQKTFFLGLLIFLLQTETGLAQNPIALQHKIAREDSAVSDAWYSHLVDSLEKDARDQHAELVALSTQRNVVVGGVILLTIIASLLYTGYRNKRSNNLRLSAQQNRINQQNVVLQELLVEKDQLLADKDALLIEKDWLLKEVHHRVKNNLQIISSLLSSQSFYLDEGSALEAITDIHNRVQSISLIHQKLYTDPDVASVNMSSFFDELIDHLKTCFDTKTKKIQFEQMTGHVGMKISQAIAVGLILNEAITNSIKYGFPDKPGRISVSLSSIGHQALRLTIADNGIGMNADSSLDGKNSLGWQMIRCLTKQLRGDITINVSSGVSIVIDFPYEKAEINKTHPVFSSV